MTHSADDSSLVVPDDGAAFVPDPVGAPPEAGVADPDRRWLTLFEDRYGAGSHDHLMALLRRPCTTFAEIASQFGVTRERVRQWYAQWVPEGPRGHQRQRLCRISQQRRRLLEDPLFRLFYQHARPHLAPGRIHLLPARNGFRARSVRVDDHPVAISRARRAVAVDGKPTYQLRPPRARADFVYYHLAGPEYLFLPAAAVPPGGTLFADVPESTYRAFKNTFHALADRQVG